MNYKKDYLLLTLMLVLTHVGITSVSAQSLNSPYINKVYEYRPAPGQFINTMPEYEDGDTEETMVEKCNELLVGEDPSMICLGGFGGYVTFGFDHPVVNVHGSADLYIMGNAFKAADASDGGSSEPGIVMVSEDVNGNGLPDDPWYELSGSADEDSIGKVIYNYQITYTYNAMKDVPWTDNQGGEGVVERNKFHRQEYFPLWLKDQPLTFNGTLLPPNGYDQSGKGSYWVLKFLRWGYVDNQPNIINGEKNPACCFDLDNAVDAQRRPVQLHQIHFVRVYTAMNQICGWLGETSTEFAGAQDLNPGTWVPGDMDGDGEITIQDIRTIAKLISNNTYSIQADVDRDGRLTVRDIAILIHNT